jgi:hypothetical protein
VTNNAEEDINAIIILSRQLLSLFDINIESTTTENNQNTVKLASSISTEISQLSDEKLSSLVTERQNFIHQLFESYTQEQLKPHIKLLTEILLFDQQLIVKSQANKKLLAEQVIKLKNSKKVRKLYNKY